MKFKRTKTFSLFTAMFFLSACTTFDITSGLASRSEYKVWNCRADSSDTDQWHCTRGTVGDAVPVDAEPQLESETQNKVDNEAGPITEKKAEKKAQQLPRQPVEIAFDISADGYTVQLGAYLSQAMAERSADKIIISQGELRVRNIFAAGRHSFVIVYGQYETQQQAQDAAEGIRVLNPGLEYWVRSIKSMRDSLE